MSGAPPSQPMSQHLGRVLGGQYRVEELLGYGGMGAVYRGVQLSVQRPVAIKLIGTGHGNSEQGYQRFRREAEATARLAHPNTVRVFDFGVTETHELYMVMELLEGCDLAARLKLGPVPLSEALLIVRQVLAALCEAHAIGIVHRDLKPGNVFLSRVHGGESFVKVMDFGIAGLAPDHAAQKLTVTGAVMGTPAYMSPEQAQGKTVDARSDLYSIGVMLFEMLTGKPPFEADTLVSMLLAHVTQPPKRLADSGVHIPEVGGVQALLDRLLAKQPAERPASAAEVAQHVDALLAGTHAHSLPATFGGHTAAAPNQSRPFTPLQWDRTEGTPRRSRSTLVVVSLAALAGLGAGAAFWVVRKPASVTGAAAQSSASANPAAKADPPLAAAPPASDPQTAAAASGDSAAPIPTQANTAAPAEPETAELPDGRVSERPGSRHSRNHPARRSASRAHDEPNQPEAEARQGPEPEARVGRVATQPSEPTTTAPTLDLSRAPPYASMAAARKAMDSGKINAAAYEAAIALLKARRTQRVALERENLQKGQITPQEYEWRLGRIDAEYRGE